MNEKSYHFKWRSVVLKVGSSKRKILKVICSLLVHSFQFSRINIRKLSRWPQYLNRRYRICPRRFGSNLTTHMKRHIGCVNCEVVRGNWYFTFIPGELYITFNLTQVLCNPLCNLSLFFSMFFVDKRNVANLYFCSTLNIRTTALLTARIQCLILKLIV